MLQRSFPHPRVFRHLPGEDAASSVTISAALGQALAQKEHAQAAVLNCWLPLHWSLAAHSPDPIDVEIMIEALAPQAFAQVEVEKEVEKEVAAPRLPQQHLFCFSNCFRCTF